MGRTSHDEERILRDIRTLPDEAFPKVARLIVLITEEFLSQDVTSYINVLSQDVTSYVYVLSHDVTSYMDVLSQDVTSYVYVLFQDVTSYMDVLSLFLKFD